MEGSHVPLVNVLKTIEENKTPASLPSIADDVRKLFLAELNAAEGTGAKIKLCRAALADPESKHTFRQIAAMDALVELLEAEALEDLLPYLGSDYWRTRDHSRALAVDLVKTGAGSTGIASFATTKSPETQAGILAVLATAKHTAAIPLAREAMKHDSATVRAAAVQTYATLAGPPSIPDILTHLKTAADPTDTQGCEDALSPFCEDPASATALRDAILKAGAPPPRMPKRSVTTSSPASATRSPSTPSARLPPPMIPRPSTASCSPSPTRPPARPTRSCSRSPPPTPSVRRSSARMLSAAWSSVQRLWRHHQRPSAWTSPMPCSRSHSSPASSNFSAASTKPAPSHPHVLPEKGFAGAAESLIANAEGMENLSPSDSKIAAKALQDVIEYIEVTRLRGGIQAHMDKDDNTSNGKPSRPVPAKSCSRFTNPSPHPFRPSIHSIWTARTLRFDPAFG
jgi:HEAT repeat protein